MLNDTEVRSKPAFTYFEVNCRGGLIKSVLINNNFDFIDIQVALTDILKIKEDPRVEFGKLPIYEEDGKVYSQVLAISRLLGSKFNLLGENQEEEYEINSLISSFDDFYPSFRTTILTGVTAENKLKQLENLLEKFLTVYERKVKKNKGIKYTVGNKLTLADHYLTFFVHYVFRHPSRKETFEPFLNKTAPILDEITLNLEKNELKEYYLKSYFNDKEL